MLRVRLRSLITALAAFVLCGEVVAAQEGNGSFNVAPLQPGDVIRLWVFREKEYSGDFTVASNGFVVLPKIGAINVRTMSPQELRAHIVAEFAKSLRDPTIDIQLLRRINVLGAVQRPNVILVDETMSVAHAVSLAGGALPTGKQDEVELYRGSERVVGRIHGATRIGDLPLQSGDQLFVPERSWAARNTALLSTALSAAVSIVVALIVSR